jgi:hypothetical protein
MSSCLTGCIESYQCGEIIETIDAASAAPFIKIFFCDSGSEVPVISVGNESSPQWGNTAIIKSFQLGMSNGIGCTVEIMDELGGAFHLFVDKLQKCMDRADKESNMGIVYGWVVTDCDGMVGVKQSEPVYLIPIDIEVNFSEGRVKFIITANDVMQNVFTARHDEAEGTDDNKVALKEAIAMLCENKSPKIQARFIRKEKNGSETTFKFRYGGEKGPKSVYTSDGQNKLSAIYRWLENFMTDRDKGIIARYNPTYCNQPTIDFIEDVSLGCDEASDCENVIGTYIINGSTKSPVISFTPKINFIASFSAMTSGGNSGSSESGGGVKQEKKCKVQTPETGITQSNAPTKVGRDVYGPKDNVNKSMEAKAAYVKAHAMEKISAIEAELRVQGDPRKEFNHPALLVGKKISLVVINPYTILGNGCGDWLATPACNDVLSNKSWQILGCDHSIKEGSYVTTFKLRLDAPGINVNPNEPFGGPGGCGYIPLNSC